MQYAIETLEIELNKWKEVERINNIQMYKNPDEWFAKSSNIASEKVVELFEAIEVLKNHKP